MTPVLQWIKSHVVVVICIVLIVGAPVASYIVAGGMVESARSDLQGRASGLRDLKSNRTTTVSLEVPGSAVASISAAPNQRLVDAYREAVEKISGQADLIRAAGLAHNRNINGRTRSGDELMPGHFPVPPGGRCRPAVLQETRSATLCELCVHVTLGYQLQNILRSTEAPHTPGA